MQPDPLPTGEPSPDFSSNQELFARLYEDLRSLANAKLAQESPGHTLQPTALVNEVYLRLVANGQSAEWSSPQHFFGAASQAMRRILVENARRKKRLKRGGSAQRVDLPLENLSDPLDADELLALDQGLEALAHIDPVKAELVTLRYFGGLSIEQSCEVLGISRTTASRYWAFARAWLFRHISDEQ